MPFNGSGVYTPPAADFPVVTNTVISSTHFNNTINDIATGLTTCLTKDGQTTPTANIKLGGFKLTGVGTPSATNDALTFGTAGTMTTLTASTSVVTPLVTTSGALILQNSIDTQMSFQINSATKWAIAATSFALIPGADNTINIGTPSLRIANVFTPIIDSGTTGPLSLNTNNGQKFAQGQNVSSAVNFISIVPNSTGNPVQVLAAGTDPNVELDLRSKGASAVSIWTGASDVIGTSSVVQCQFPHTASATRNITITGSNGGNPTISTTAGSLAITPVVIIAGASITIGTSPGSGGSVNVPYNTSFMSNNSAGSGSLSAVNFRTVNSVTDILDVAASSTGTSNGAIIKGRSGGAAPTTSDLPASYFTVWRDTGGTTTKLYYNNAGSIQSVALA